MAQEMPEFTNWKDAWEWHAQQTHTNFSQHTEDELLRKIEQRHYDQFYTIWDALANCGTVEKSAPVLLEVLRREAGESLMLIRYHCAGALFRLLGYPDEPMPALRKQVQWDTNGEQARQEALDTLEVLINEHLTEAPPGSASRR